MRGRWRFRNLAPGSRTRNGAVRKIGEGAIASWIGLGLSLVAAVARLHGGSLRLEDNAPGLRAVLSLPTSGHAHC